MQIRNCFWSRIVLSTSCKLKSHLFTVHTPIPLFRAGYSFGNYIEYIYISVIFSVINSMQYLSLFLCSSNKGMNFLVGDDWRELFDVVIVNARKPKFFTETSRPLR